MKCGYEDLQTPVVEREKSTTFFGVAEVTEVISEGGLLRGTNLGAVVYDSG
mgnify:CR=1 FL=1|jgi:hypothetical protein